MTRKSYDRIAVACWHSERFTKCANYEPFIDGSLATLSPLNACSILIGSPWLRLKYYISKLI